MNSNEEKANFRKYCLEKLKKCSNQNRFYKNAKINSKILILLKYLKAKNVLVYMPLKMEVNLKHVFRNRGKYSFCTPFMLATSFKIVQYRLPVFEKKFGIKEPSNSFKKMKKIDIAIVPVVGIDKDYKRIGFGKGMYDRFFASLNYKPKIVFVQICECQSPNKLSESFDIKADFYITDKKFLYVRGCVNGDRITDCRRYFSPHKFSSNILYSEKAQCSKFQYIFRTGKSKSKSHRT